MHKFASQQFYYFLFLTEKGGVDKINEKLFWFIETESFSLPSSLLIYFLNNFFFAECRRMNNLTVWLYRVELNIIRKSHQTEGSFQFLDGKFPESAREIFLDCERKTFFSVRARASESIESESNVEICVNHNRRLLDDDYERM